MNTETQKSLERAKAYCYAWNVRAAYPIFRRYFDRLPFEPEPAHAEYIGFFVRVLFEMGKELELKFYMRHLEALYQINKSAFVAYPLGVVYSYSGFSKAETARRLFEEILIDSQGEPYHARARMMLANFYLERGDLEASRRYIEEIPLPQPDPMGGTLVEIWRAVIERREGQADLCRRRLEALLPRVNRRKDWYGYFSAKVVLGMAYLDLGDVETGRTIVDEVRRLFAGRRLKLAQVQMAELEKLLREKSGQGSVQYESESTFLFLFADKRFCLKTTSRTDLLLLRLLQQGNLERNAIIESLYHRPYRGKRDDQRIYRYIYSLRRRLHDAGLPSGIIAREGNRYCLAEEIKKVNYA
jgi:hypothetical protein